MVKAGKGRQGKKRWEGMRGKRWDRWREFLTITIYMCKSKSKSEGLLDDRRREIGITASQNAHCLIPRLHLIMCVCKETKIHCPSVKN